MRTFFFLFSLNGGSHLFNGIQNHIADDCHLLLLAEADGTADGLRFDGRVPLGLNNVYPGCDSEIEASLSAAQFVKHVLAGDIPNSTGAESH